MASMIGEDERDEQNHGDDEEAPTGADGEPLGHRTVNESGGEHGDQSGPAGLAENFDGFGHGSVSAGLR